MRYRRRVIVECTSAQEWLTAVFVSTPYLGFYWLSCFEPFWFTFNIFVKLCAVFLKTENHTFCTQKLRNTKTKQTKSAQPETRRNQMQH